VKVRDLIYHLNKYDGDAEVLLCNQQSYPFEYSIEGVTSREEIENNDDDYGGERSDVLLLEGNQIRYGTKRAWGDFL